jgi:hypothetical protein
VGGPAGRSRGRGSARPQQNRGPRSTWNVGISGRSKAVSPSSRADWPIPHRGRHGPVRHAIGGRRDERRRVARDSTRARGAWPTTSRGARGCMALPRGAGCLAPPVGKVSGCVRVARRWLRADCRVSGACGPPGLAACGQQGTGAGRQLGHRFRVEAGGVSGPGSASTALRAERIDRAGEPMTLQPRGTEISHRPRVAGATVDAVATGDLRAARRGARPAASSTCSNQPRGCPDQGPGTLAGRSRG